MRITAEDQARIAQAIATAESRTSGEIFCVLMHSASDYRLVPLAWASALALIVPWPLVTLTTLAPTTIYIAQLAAFIFFAWALSRPGLRFALVPRATRRARAHAEAERQFAAHGLHRTVNRTGVLIFASIGERYAEVIADTTIAGKVEQQVWDEAIDVLTSALSDDRPADGFIAAIERCGEILAAHAPPGALDRNELPNMLIEL